MHSGIGRIAGLHRKRRLPRLFHIKIGIPGIQFKPGIEIAELEASANGEVAAVAVGCGIVVGIVVDSDLTAVYGMETGALNRAVDGNELRFPPAFAFRLASGEWEILKCQIGISSSWGGRRRSLPRVFTEHGATALAMVLNSERAIKVGIQVIHAFVRLRRVLDVNRSLARKIDELAEKVDKHDRAIAVVFHELRQLAAGTTAEPEPEKPKGRIGFRTAKEREQGGKAKRRK